MDVRPELSSGLDGGRGWAVLAAICISTMLVMGTTTYGYGVFVKPVGAELGVGRGAVNSGAVLMNLCVGLFAPPLGRLIDRVRPQTGVLAGVLAYAAGLGIISYAHRLPGFVAGIALAAIGMIAAGTIMANTLAARWFARKRGLAMVAAAIAASAGGAVVVPLVGMLVARLGWRATLRVEAIAVLGVVTLLALLVVRDPPWRSTSSRLPPTAPGDPGARVWTARTLLASRNFWLLSIGIGLVFGIDGALLLSLVPYATDRGLSLAQGTLLVSCLTGSAIAGKLVIAAVIDRAPRRRLLAIVIACNLIFVSALLAGLNYGLLLAACCVVGVSVGGTAPLWYGLAADLFGARSYGAVLGAMNLVVMAFTVGATRLVGDLYDRTGSYDLALKIFLAGSAAAILCVALLGRPQEPDAGA